MNKIFLTLDLLGLKCPLPVLKTAKKLKEIKQGELLEVKTDDPSAEEDLNKLCIVNNSKIIKRKKQNKILCVLIKKG
jgi:tRNA 2-thiouridine synthesizing protein A|tara:strand:+ start:138 stop:368 length:231 start_codon:yes stop_codon:yes gene_type:complete